MHAHTRAHTRERGHTNIPTHVLARVPANARLARTHARSHVRTHLRTHSRIHAFPKRNDCPHTTALVRKHGKHLASVFFSVLEPGTTLAPHAGPNSGVVRCHIPIIIPKDTSRLGLRHETNAGVRVERWDAPFIFDDTRVHSAWNHTSEQRVVLLLEVIRPMSTVQHALFSLALHLASLSSVADRI